jgi:TetR/AcrR family transcriptional regulator, transcriptional repressor for nem operon
MPRPRAFDTADALRAAAGVFWQKGFAGTSTEALLDSMGIGRQSLYNSFGDKRQLYLDALRLYSQESVRAHIVRLDAPSSPLQGIRELLRGLAVDGDDERARGCFGVTAATEFGMSDADVLRIAQEAGAPLRERITARLIEALAAGEVAEHIDVEAAATFVLQQMTSLQVAARGGADQRSMRSAADFAVNLLAT